MKLAKATALQSLNQNKVTDKALSRSSSSFSPDNIVPCVELRRWPGFRGTADYRAMQRECTALSIDGELQPCNLNQATFEAFWDAYLYNRPFNYPVCCEADIELVAPAA